MTCPHGAESERRPRVLIIDDDDAYRLLLAHTIRADEYDVELARNGFEALETVMDDPPDLILLDVMMPGLDGIETCRRLSEDPRTQSVPVILITALSEAEDVIDGLDAGAVDYMTKPYQRPVVRARVRVALRSKLAQDRLRQQHEEIMNLADALESRNQALAELTATAHRFVASVADEIRSPLDTIKATCSHLGTGEHGVITDAQQQSLGVIADATSTLAGTVEALVRDSAKKLDEAEHMIGAEAAHTD